VYLFQRVKKTEKEFIVFTPIFPFPPPV